MCQAKNEIPQQSDEWKTEIFTKMNGKSNKKKNHTKEATEMKKRRKKTTHSSNEGNIYDKF